MMCDARELFLKQRRFDLIFKYLYVTKPNNAFVRAAYLENIRAFNGYFELEPSDGIAKDTPEKFISSFDALIKSMRENGFRTTQGGMPLGVNGDIVDGAHRLSVASALALPVEVEKSPDNFLFDYNFFLKQQMAPSIMDYGAQEYVRLNPNAYIVNLHAVTNPCRDREVEAILNEKGFIYYKKSLRPTYNGYVNLKKLSYGSFWERESWIGTVENGFRGAQEHASASMGKGKNPLRVYVFVCDSKEKVVEAKAQIRALYGIGNYSVHINDTHEEAIALAETYFNANSWFAINHRPFTFEDERFDNLIEELKTFVAKRKGSLDEVCVTTSAVLNVFGLRKCDDFDFLVKENSGLEIESKTLSSHCESNDFYTTFYTMSVASIIDDPSFHFLFRGVKFASPQEICEMKKRRWDLPKDKEDVALLTALLATRLDKRMLLLLRKALSIAKDSIYKKEKHSNGVRKVRLLGIKFSYKRSKR